MSVEAVPQAVVTQPAEDEVLGQLMLGFSGLELPDAVARRLADRPAAGVTLFRRLNVASAAQVRSLAAAIQALAPPGLPFLVAVDQEGGQLLGLGNDSTPFAGNMALGAVGDPELAERVGRAIGIELRACGANVNYAPVCDLATNPRNPGLGVRSFGDDPARAAPLVAGFVRGLTTTGVAATLKHFPGKGEAAVDTHHQLAVVDHDRSRFDRVELTPFRAGLQAGARLVMSGHFAAPALTGDPLLPATLSPAVLEDLLRGELGFEGVAISDALDMKALAQGSAQIVDAIAALRAGIDLLLLTADQAAQERIEEGLRQAVRRRLLDPSRLAAARRRVLTLRSGLDGAPQPDPGVVGCVEHQALAQELAARSLTRVRDSAGLLPLRPSGDQSIGVVMPMPADLTPADTSSSVAPSLAAAIRRRHPATYEYLVPQSPGAAEVASVREAAGQHGLLIVGTVSASLQPGQAELVRALLALGIPTVTIALRTPWDLAAYPTATTHVCTYSILPPSLEALAAGLWGEAGFPGRLPVRLELR